MAVSGDVLERVDGGMYRRSYYPVRIDGAISAHVWRYDDVTDMHRRTVALERSTAVLQAMVRAHAPAVRSSSERAVFSNLLDSLIELSGSAYGFIGEVDHDDGGPFLRSWAVSDIAWDAASRDFFSTAMREKDLQASLGKAFAGTVLDETKLAREAIDRGIPISTLKKDATLVKDLHTIVRKYTR